MQSALCAAALLAHATLLPLLHVEHGFAAALERAAHGFTSCQASATLREAPATAGSTHDAASCAICASLAQSRAGVMPAGCNTVGLHPAQAAVVPNRVVAVAPAGFDRVLPRGPPALAA